MVRTFHTHQKSRSAFFFALSSLLALAGSACSSSTQSARYDALARDFEPAARAPAAREPDDTTEGAVLDRAAYIRAVLQRNPSVEAARHGVRAALAHAKGAGGFEDPMVDLQLAPLSIGSSEAPFGYEVGISQKLPWFGKRSLEAAVAEAEAEAAKNDYEATRQELALAALGLYSQYVALTRSLEINTGHVKLMRAMRDGMVAQFGSGRGTTQDSLQAEVALAHMEHDAVILATEREVTVAQMNELLHRRPESPLPPPPRELPLAPEPDASFERLESDRIRGRADVSAALQRARAEQARAERASHDAYPDVVISTSYNSMWDMPEHRWMVGLGFALPIQSAGRSGAEDEALAARARFESEALRMTDAARTAVFVAHKKLEESKHVLQIFETRLVPVAREQVDAVRAGFVTAQNSFVSVIDAERNLRQTELDYQLARSEHDRRRGELDRALGLVPGLDWQETPR